MPHVGDVGEGRGRREITQRGEVVRIVRSRSGNNEERFYYPLQ